MGTTDTKLLFSGCQEHITGSNLEFQLPSRLGNHSIAWGCNWRQLYGFNPNVPMSIREHAGHTLKSSIKVYKHHFTGTLLRVWDLKHLSPSHPSLLLPHPLFLSSPPSPPPPSTIPLSLPPSFPPHSTLWSQMSETTPFFLGMGTGCDQHKSWQGLVGMCSLGRQKCKQNYTRR